MTIHNSAFNEGHCSSIKDVEGILSDMPAPKSKKKKKKKKAAAEDDDDAGGAEAPDATSDGGKKKKKKKKKKKAKASDIPDFPQLMRGRDISCDEAVKQTTGWSANHIIAKKMSVGTLTTANYDERTATFNKMNPNMERSSIFP